MTDEQEHQTEKHERAPGGEDNAVTHGACRYIMHGELPKDLLGLDKEIAAEILKQIGNDERYRLAATATARAFVVVELIWRHIVRTYDPASTALPPGLKIFGSYQESLRRNLEALGLTPASAGKVKLDDDDPVSAAKVLEEVKKGG